MSELDRRDALRAIALSLTAGAFTLADAQHVHEAVAAAKPAGVYKLKALNPQEAAAVRLLCETVIPGAASQGGAVEFIDLLCSANEELLTIWAGGLAWIDRACEDRYQAVFVKCSAAQQKELLDLLAYRKNETPEIAAGIRFFRWVRRMSADAYYTSAAGMKELGFQGNGALRKFEVPKEAVDYALKRSGY